MTRAEAIRMLLTIVEECEKHGSDNGGGCRECPLGCGVNCGRGDANYCPNCGAKMKEGD